MLRKMSAARGLMVLLLVAGLGFGASAQRGGGHYFHGGGGHVVVYPRTYVGVGFGLGYGLYSPFYPYYGFYGPFGWGYPYGPYSYGGYYGTPPRLQAQISDIKQDYSQQISAVKSDKSLTGKERRTRIRELKNERDQAVDQAKRDFWYGPSRSNGNGPKPYKGNDGTTPQNNNNNSKPQNSGSQSGNSGDQPEYSETGS